MEPALCQLHRHTFVRYSLRSLFSGKCCFFKWFISSTRQLSHSSENYSKVNQQLLLLAMAYPGIVVFLDKTGTSNLHDVRTSNLDELRNYDTMRYTCSYRSAYKAESRTLSFICCAELNNWNKINRTNAEKSLILENYCLDPTTVRCDP